MLDEVHKYPFNKDNIKNSDFKTRSRNDTEFYSEYRLENETLTKCQILNLCVFEESINYYDIPMFNSSSIISP